MTGVWWKDIVPDPRSADEIEAAKEANLQRQHAARERERKERAKYPVVSAQAAHEQWLDEMEKPVDSGVSTGFASMDAALTRPIRPGEWVAIGARTGVGKTWICQHLVERKLSEDLASAVLFMNMEMPSYEMAGRIASNVLGVTPDEAEQRARDGRVMREGFVEQMAPHLSRLAFAERANIRVPEISKALENANDELGIAPTVVVVDYMGLLGGPQNTYERASENAKQLKDFAINYGVIVLAAVQLSRSGGRDGSHEPHLDDLRDSGVIEEAADRVMLFWRESEASEGDDHPIVFGKIAKNRHGKVGGRSMLKFEDGMRLREMTEQERYALADDPSDSQPRHH